MQQEVQCWLCQGAVGLVQCRQKTEINFSQCNILILYEALLKKD